jgi:glycine/D-amino acid oxidase-like deaminating enzyme
LERTEHLIIGQGLAGSVLAWTLSAQGSEIRIIDRDEGALCSRVAGGMINPISPRLPTKGWRAEIHFPEAESFYRNIELKSGAAFYHPRPIYRPYKHAEEKERWNANARKKGFDRFLWPKGPERIPGVRMDPELGAAAFQGAFLDIPAFLESTAEHFLRQKRLHRESFQPHELVEKKEGWEYKGIRADRVILCQGTGIRDCPFFGQLPLRPNKGEILTLDMPTFPEEFILNRGFYAIPTGHGRVRVGASYDHQDEDPTPTAEKRNELLNRMEEWIDHPYKVLEHRTGFRPTTPDTRPYVGFHPEKKGLAVLNGLGSKGVSLAPYWAKKLTEKLKEGNEEAPDPAVALDRFKSNEKTAKA